MPNPFMDRYFASPFAGWLWEQTHDFYSGGKWIVTPATDPNLQKNLAVWWRMIFNDFSNHLDKGEQDRLEPLAREVFVGLAKVVNPPAGVSRDDLIKNVVNPLNKLDKMLPDRAKLVKDNPGAEADMWKMIDASFSATKSLIVMSENAARAGNNESLSDTFHDVMVRDCAAALYDLTKDPPRELYLHTADLADGYLATVLSNGFARTETMSKFQGYVADFVRAKAALAAAPPGAPQPALEAQRREAMIGMGVMLEELRTRARSGASVAQHQRGFNQPEKIEAAAKMASAGQVAAETMRAVYGMPARGGVGHMAAPPHAETLQRGRGREAVEEIQGRISKEREERGL